MTIYLHTLAFIYGLLIGSFLNVCIYRIPRRESVAHPPSHCTDCGTRLTAIDLVPVFSYLFLRGKCRHCGSRISSRYMSIELLTAVVYLILFYRYGNNGNYIEFFAASFLMSILISIFFIDLKHKVIPDSLVITGLIGGVIIFTYNLFASYNIYNDGTWWNPLLAVVIGCGFLLTIHGLGRVLKMPEGMGIGDVKLFAVIGLFLGWKMTLIALVLSIVVGVVSGLILFISKRKSGRDSIPFGSFASIATFVTLLFGFYVC